MDKICRTRITLGITLLISFASILHVDVAYANEDVWTKLVEGGKVVLMRHSSISKGRGFGNSLVRDPSCKAERNLSSEGEAEARAVGERFKQRNIPIAEVRSSPYCRAADTAKIAFGNVTPVDYLSLREVLSPEEAAAQTGKLNQAIGSYVGKGNLILVTHEPNIGAVSFETLGHSDLLVLQPKGGDKFDEIGVVTFKENK